MIHCGPFATTGMEVWEKNWLSAYKNGTATETGQNIGKLLLHRCNCCSSELFLVSCKYLCYS